jgi:hypothetical protein
MATRFDPNLSIPKFPCLPISPSARANLRISFLQQKINKIIKDFDQGRDNALNFGEFLAVFDKELQLGGTKTAPLRIP